MFPSFTTEYAFHPPMASLSAAKPRPVSRYVLERRSVCQKGLTKSAPESLRGGAFRPLCVPLHPENRRSSCLFVAANGKPFVARASERRVALGRANSAFCQRIFRRAPDLSHIPLVQSEDSWV